MRKLGMVALLAALPLILVACAGTKHAAKLPPKPCRITSTRAACRAYLLDKARRAHAHDAAWSVDVRVHCPDRKYPALCKKH